MGQPQLSTPATWLRRLDGPSTFNPRRGCRKGIEETRVWPLNPSLIADRDARRLAIVLREVGGEGAPIGGGWMACDVPGSWADHAVGLGMDGPVEGPTLDALVAFYRQRERTPRIQVTPYQHPSLLRGLEARGFSSYGEERVLVRGLADRPPVEAPQGVVFRPVDPSKDDDVAAFRASQMTGFFEDAPPPPGMLPIMERVARSPRCSLWLIELDGRVVGSGGLESFEDAAVLIAACVHREARRQGLQTAFIRFRLEQAAAMGLGGATVASTPGGPTERNALRTEFSVAYRQTRLEQR